MISTNEVHTAEDADRNDPARALPIMEDGRPRPRRLRFRLGTLLFAIAVLALLLVVIIQQVQLERMRRIVAAQRQQIDRHADEKAQLRSIVQALRGYLERDARWQRSKAEPSAAPDHR
jgi:cell division protein FtsB